MGERKVGENFDSNEANDIFDKLRNVEGKIKPKREGKFDNIAHLMQEAKSLENTGVLDEAITLYKEVLLMLPDSSKAYEALIRIFQKQGDEDSEKEILKKAITSCSKNDEFKKFVADTAKQIAITNPANVESLLEEPSIEDSSKTIKDIFKFII